nr:LacI family DNA-binding transcriptional regulator [uncultured Cohaesibacter sp.]
MKKDNDIKPVKVTIKTVAKDAGVSVAAVSKVLRNAYGVSDNLRQTVQESIDRLGYRPSTAARGMRGKTYTIGLLLVNIDNPFLPEVIEGVNGVLAQAKYQTMIGVGRAKIMLETAMIDAMIDYRLDGLILIGPRIAGEYLEKYAKQIPIVVVGHHETNAMNFDTVNSDDRLGTQLVIDAFVKAGHTKIDMLSLMTRPNMDSNVVHIRENAYRAAMKEAGLQDHIKIFYGHEETNLAHEDANEYLSQRGETTAVFCWSDLHGIPLINAAFERGVRVPEDLAIASYDNSPFARLPIIGLTSVSQNAIQLGELAAQTLLERIEGRDVPTKLLIEPELVRRRSL